MNRIKNNLSVKIFLGIFLILLAVSLSMFGILRIFMPKTYEDEMAAQITADIQTLAKQSETASQDQWESMLIQFCLINNTGATIINENKEQVASYNISVYTSEDDMVTLNENRTAVTFSSTFENSGKLYIVAAYPNAGAVDQVTGIFAKVFPFMLIIIIIISTLTAFFYSRFLAKPIVDICNVSKKMTTLNMSWRCDVSRSDEIGVLAANLNEMAIKLESTMKDLQTANEKLQADIERERKQERRRRDFFSAISHELKTPVTILKGELDGMILNVGKFKDRDKYLQEASETTESIEKLVREIMKLAKLETLSLRPEDVRLSGLTNECCRMYDVLAQSKHIKINSYYKDNIITSVDKGQMRTVLSNIIGNAVKHSPEGSHIDIRASHKDGKIELSVENSGIHIGNDEFGQIWEPFYRTDKSRSRDTGGSGLGLYIVKTILDLHKLEYQFENTDIGMIFKIIF